MYQIRDRSEDQDQRNSVRKWQNRHKNTQSVLSPLVLIAWLMSAIFLYQGIFNIFNKGSCQKSVNSVEGIYVAAMLFDY